MLALPLAVRYLGADRFGVWATITSTVVFLNLLDLGVAGTLTNHIARSYATGDCNYAARYTANALALTIAVACLSGAAIVTAWPWFEWVRVLNVPPSVSRTEVQSTAAVAIALVLLGLPASLCGRIFAGYQEVHAANMAVAVGTIANLVGLFIGIAFRMPLPALFVLATGWIPLCNLTALGGLLFWQKAWLRPRLSLVRWTDARELLGSGSGFFLLQIAGVVVFSSDNLVVSHYLGAAQVTSYSVTWRVVGLAAVAQGLAFPALWPAYAEAYAKGDLAWMRSTFRTTMRATLIFNLGFALVLLAAGKSLIRWWAGSVAVPSTGLLAAMALWVVISGCMTVESCLLAAVNRTRVQGVLSIVAAALNISLSIFLVQQIGAVGVIVGTIASYLLVLVVPQTLLVRGVLRSEHDSRAVQNTPLPATSCH